MTKILITGPQGSGKTTQTEALARYLGVHVVDPGQMLRDWASLPTQDGLKIKDSLDKGELVDNEIVGRMVRERLEQPDCQKGFVVDGYPRSLPQLEIFDPKYDKVFYLDLSDEKAKDRLVKRGRDDDKPKSIEERLEIYHKLTEPVLKFYQHRGILVRIPADDSIENIQQKIRGFVRV